MLKTVLSFTDLSIRALPEGYHFDTKLASFGIRVGKRRKTWLVVKGKNRTKVTIGHYPALSLSDARKKALIALGSPYVKTTAPAFPDALEAFLLQPRWKPYSKYIIEHSIHNHFHFTKSVDKITHEDVAQALDLIKAPSTRSHALKDIKAFFNWCVPRYIPYSPCVGFKMPPYKKRKRVLVEQELAKVWFALRKSPEPFATIVRLLIVTGQRKSEIGTLKWQFLSDSSITLPETKNGREHTFPLGKLAKSLIRSVPAARGATYLFPGKREGKPYNGWGKHVKDLKKNSGTDGWTLHDLRRTFATGLASLGVQIHITEKIINHVSGSTGGIVEVYQQFQYWDEQVAALKSWEKKIQLLARSG